MTRSRPILPESAGRAAVSVSAALISAGVHPGCFCLTRAAAPAVRGAEKDVPAANSKPLALKIVLAPRCGSGEAKRFSPAEESSWQGA